MRGLCSLAGKLFPGSSIEEVAWFTSRRDYAENPGQRDATLPITGRSR